MADVTDAAFRQIIAKYSAHKRLDGSVGGPDVTWTEFVSADGLKLAPEPGRQKLLVDLKYTEAERPIVAQLFSSKPENMEYAAALCLELGFDGVDINMGCPDRAIERQGCGSAMIKNPTLAREIIKAAKRGAKSDAGGIPVSVKTRAGYNRDELDTWLPELLAEEPAVVTIHARTRKEMSKVPARWDRVTQAVSIRNAIQGKEGKTLILGNGDVPNRKRALELVEETGADGVMFGRAIFGNPWLFHDEKDQETVSTTERLLVMLEHTKLFKEELGDLKSFALMKKHYKAYVKDFPGASELRHSLMEQDSYEAIAELTQDFIANLKS